MPKSKSLSRRLSDIEKKHGISGNYLAKLLGVTSTDYHGSLKNNKNPPNSVWRIALAYIEHYGLELLIKRLGEKEGEQ